MSGKGGGVPKEQAASIARKAANMAVQQAGQQPKSKSKKGKTKSKSKKGSSKGGMDSVVMAHVNPFVVGARVRWPDEDATPSVAFRSRTIFNIPRVANTDGSVPGRYFGVRFLAHPNFAYNAGPFMTGTAPNKTFPVTGWDPANDRGVSEDSSLANSFSRWRIVNWGVRIKGLGQVLTNQGSLYAITAADQPDIFPVAPYSTSLRKSVIMLNGRGPDFVWISKPLDNTAREYREFGTFGELTTSWESLYLYSDDNAGSSPLLAEIIMNLELIPKSGDFSERLAQKALPADPGLLTKIMNTFQTVANVVMNNETVQNVASSAVSQAVNFAANEAGRRIAAQMPSRQGGRPHYFVEEL